MLTHCIRTSMPYPHLRPWLTFVLPPPLDLVSLYLTLFPFQSHNSSSFLPCLILIKILSWSLVLLTDTTMSSHFFGNFDKETDFPHKSTSFTYPPHPLGTEVTLDRLLLLLWTLQSSLQPVPTSFLAESSLWPNMLLTSPTTPMLNEPHTMLFTHALTPLEPSTKLLFSSHTTISDTSLHTTMSK